MAEANAKSATKMANQPPGAFKKPPPAKQKAKDEESADDNYCGPIPVAWLDALVEHAKQEAKDPPVTVNVLPAEPIVKDSSFSSNDVDRIVNAIKDAPRQPVNVTVTGSRKVIKDVEHDESGRVSRVIEREDD